MAEWSPGQTAGWLLGIEELSDEENEGLEDLLAEYPLQGILDVTVRPVLVYSVPVGLVVTYINVAHACARIFSHFIFREQICSLRHRLWQASSDSGLRPDGQKECAQLYP